MHWISFLFFKQEDWVLCRVFSKDRNSVNSKPKALATYNNDSRDAAFGATYLPPLTDSHVIASSQNQFASEASNLGFGFGFEQVPCFSSFNSGSSSLCASNCKPPVMNTMEKFNPQLGQCLDPMQYESAFLKVVLGQLSKPNLSEGSCEAHLSETAPASCWNPFWKFNIELSAVCWWTLSFELYLCSYYLQGIEYIFDNCDN